MSRMAELHAELTDIAEGADIDVNDLIAWIEHDATAACTKGTPVWMDCPHCGPSRITHAVMRATCIALAPHYGVNIPQGV